MFNVSSIIDTLTTTTCPEADTSAVDESKFLSGGLNWDAHRVGWAIAGGCAVLTTLTGGVNVWRHARNYRKPLEQRQTIRILLMPIVFAIISFLGYRWFREFVYFEFVRDTYEAFTLAAFLCLMLSILSESPVEQRELLAAKEKRRLVLPFCCWRFRPSKPYFIWAVKWSVMQDGQFVIVKPGLAVASVVTQALGVYCETSYSFAFADVYLMIVDFICVSIALYGLIVALIFYQGLVFSVLTWIGVIQATEYWTTTNISDGLNALVTTFEMVLIAIFQFYAYPASEYIPEIEDDSKPTSFWKSFLHSQNYSDFAIDIYLSIKFFIDWLRNKPYTKAPHHTHSTAPSPDSTSSDLYPPTKNLSALTTNPSTSKNSDRWTSGNNYDLVGAFSWAHEAYVPPSPLDSEVAKPLDPQRPYITPQSWGAIIRKEGYGEEGVRVEDSRKGHSARQRMVEYGNLAGASSQAELIGGSKALSYFDTTVDYGGFEGYKSALTTLRERDEEEAGSGSGRSHAGSLGRDSGGYARIAEEEHRARGGWQAKG
ncbi:hypothetical protein MNV49_007143 [Pseudohyphozyma bogoriensis]|nr:hypothetical protein MNV49_007143 [Pseudohyphozyma bogoriensis]